MTSELLDTMPPTDLDAPAPTSTPAPAPAAPAGYTTLERGGAYFRALGSTYQRLADDGTVVVAVRVDASHANIIGVAHGGMLMTLADGAMGINLNLSRAGTAKSQAVVTTTMSSEFLSAAQVGDWLEAHTRIRRNGRRIVFVDCTLKVGEREVLHASGTFLPI
ncbi:PaaI family thioesterase [Burkholderia guangdongensis]|uniref:PaaI family thioesterase n=1 Tax=Burkholderia guangdongensis TaxID=1792500 RepID=UPI0015CA87F4|nr:PaaI family thioesterase [Burkholderia guangdongensis]